MTSPLDVVHYEQHPDRVDAVVLAPTGDRTTCAGETPVEALEEAVEQMQEG